MSALETDPAETLAVGAADADQSRSMQRIVGVVFVSAMFMNALDITIVNVALPTLGAEFGVATASIEWVVIGYLLSLALFIPASGWLGDRFGTKRVFLFALAVFVGASMLCGLATSVPQLVAARVLQGVGGGMLTPVGTAMLYRTFPPAARARATRVLVLPTVVAPAIGPVLGGFLVDQLSWRWIFFVNLPIGIAAFTFGLLKLREHREPLAGGIDIAGFILSGVGLAATMYGLSEGPAQGWLSPTTIGPLALGAVAITALVVVELRKRAPLLDLRLLENRLFRAANLTCVFAFSSFFGVLFLVPVFLQEARGFSALESGLTTFPEAIGVMITSQIAGRLYPRVGPRRLIMGGLVALAAVVLVLSTVDQTTGEWQLRALMFAVGASISFFFISIQTSAFATVSSASTGRASAIYNTQRQTSSALGISIVASLVPVAGIVGAEALASYHRAFVVTAGLAIIGAVVASFIKDEDAAGTMLAPAGAAALAET